MPRYRIIRRPRMQVCPTCDGTGEIECPSPRFGVDDDTPGRVHRGDPWTSRSIAKRLKTGGMRRKVLEELKLESLTDFELGDRVGARPTSAGTRRKELQEMGLVRNSGQYRLSPYGNPSVVWEVTEDGLSA